MSPYAIAGTAIVTGAANGIGRASALALARAGADIAALDREVEPLESLGHEIEALGRRVLALAVDCTDEGAVAAAVARIEAQMAPATVLFNNVGQSAREEASAFLESTEETWRRVIEVSLMTTLRMSRLVAPGMTARKAGRIVNMSTESAFYGDSGLADYAAAKMGVIGFTRSLARELAPAGVAVNAVAPGAIRTRAHDRLPAAVLDRIRQSVPMGFVAEPDDVAHVVVFLASGAARYITGQTLLIDGGRWMI
ncbi:MAG: SDR family NAD(P)-dependent oxidoreductase [Rhodospirillales bacterium]